MRTVVKTLIFSMVLAILASGCSDTSKKENDNSSQANQQQDNSEKVSSSEDVYYSVGETHHFKTPIGNYKLTLDEVEITDQVNGEKAETGRFVIPTFTIENTGDSTITVEDAFSTFDLLTKVSKKSSTIQFGNEQLWAGNIESGETETGRIYYVIKGDSYTLQSDYITSDMKNRRVGWEFTNVEKEK